MKTALLIGAVLLFGAACEKHAQLRASAKIDGAAVDARLPAKPDAQVATPGAPDDLVDAIKVVPDLVVDIRYATTNNFVGKRVYPAARCLLRRAVAEMLAKVARDLASQGLRLKVWDCYRPFSVQETLWRQVSDPRYVARPVRKDGKPFKGSKHNRGAAVDITLVDKSGNELPMPTDYDDFSEKAHRTAAGISEERRKNALILESAMQARAFFPLPTEWWHFDGPGWKSYPLSDDPLVQSGSDATDSRKR